MDLEQGDERSTDTLASEWLGRGSFKITLCYKHRVYCDTARSFNQPALFVMLYNHDL